MLIVASFNNNHQSQIDLGIKRVNSVLRSNRRILKSLCPTGKATVRKEVLENMGFSFRHFSSIYPSKTMVYYLCYDYAFAAIREKSQKEGKETQKVMIVQYQGYMKTFDPWEFSR